MMESELDFEQIEEIGLNPKAVSLHKKRIMQALEKQEKPQLKVLDTCRKSNGGILSPNWAKALPKGANSGFAAFIPAAGASSRYISSLEPLETALKSGQKEAIVDTIKAMRQEGASHWALPKAIKNLIEKPQIIENMSHEQAMDLAESIRRPKAMMPCTKQGHSFLEMKLAEHRSLKGIDAEVYVVPQGYQNKISNYIKSKQADSEKAPLIIEQGPMLSTLRFNKHGEALRDDSNQLAIVPAGHGTLTTLFPKCAEAFASCHSILIRNIDNVMGSKPHTIQATETFLESHAALLQQIKKIRKGLHEGEPGLTESSHVAEMLTETVDQTLDQESEAFIHQRAAEYKSLFKLLCTLFQMSPQLIESLRTDHESDLELLIRLYERPVNSLGQVPNEGHDVGGTPAFVKLDGIKQKLCVEVPHVSKDDYKTYLADSNKATHFNPVFVAAELPASEDAYPLDAPLWLLAEKQYRNQTVYYHESVLYELLGNNSLANAVFVEIPRHVFNPHKSLRDGSIRSIEEWV